ncbi:MAG: ATP-binding protein [Gemmatimonadaceae bacterium]
MGFIDEKMMRPANLRLIENTHSRSTAGDVALMTGDDSTHVVQFYENDAYLESAVSDFLAAGLRSGQPVVVIATPPHRDAFTLRLKSKGLDVDRAAETGQLTMLDAHTALSGFMSGSLPDAQRFRQTIGEVLSRSVAGTTHTVTRAYGEMVDVLWKEGNREGAIRLEELWNELAASHSFSLLCAYGIENFKRESDSPGFELICRQHAHVIPTERYTQASDDTRLLEISILQQRARALEAEVEERRELESQLRAAAEEREALLERERRARGEAEAASRAKSEFLAIMSHELRTPLNAIGGYVQLVEMGVHGPVTETQRDALARVQRSQQHLLSLINDMLNLVRIEMGRVEYVIEEISVAPLLSDVTAMVEPLFAEKNLRCEVATPAGPGKAAAQNIRGDREKVRQILLNLLTNAIKYTEAGGEIKVSATESPEGSGKACVHIRDTGIGIPDSKLDSIFEPFVQLATRPVPGRQGVGLGLAISRDLARRMGGDITVVSTLGEGTTFTLSLPAA